MAWGRSSQDRRRPSAAKAGEDKQAYGAAEAAPFQRMLVSKNARLKECALGRVLQRRVNRGFPQTVDEAASTLLKFSSRGVPVRGASRVLRRTAGSRAIRDGP